MAVQRIVLVSLDYSSRCTFLSALSICSAMPFDWLAVKLPVSNVLFAPETFLHKYSQLFPWICVKDAQILFILSYKLSGSRHRQPIYIFRVWTVRAGDTLEIRLEYLSYASWNAITVFYHALKFFLSISIKLSRGGIWGMEKRKIRALWIWYYSVV